MVALTLAMKTFEARVVGGDTLEPYEATEAFIKARVPCEVHAVKRKRAHCETQTRTLSGPPADGAVYDNTGP